MEIFLTGIQSNTKYLEKEKKWHGENDELLDLNYVPDFQPSKIIGSKRGIWRYGNALPIENESNIVTFNEPETPLVKMVLQNKFEVLIKQDFLFSTGSYKDRGASVLMSKIKELGIKQIVQDSSGNAGASIAAYARRAGIACQIFVPKDVSPSKTTQVKAFGSNLIEVNGNRMKTASVAFEAAKKSYYASHCYNPYFFQGTKTFAYELCEQLNWKSPDSVVLPVGNGTLILGCYIGFSELAKNGVISKIPKLIGVQSKNCNPIEKTWLGQAYNPLEFSNLETLAEGIAIPNPIRLNQIVDAIIETKGSVISVTELEIANAWKYISNQGFFIEPTSAATIAGLLKYTETLNSHELVVSLFSGNGLKSIDKIRKMLDINQSA